MRIGFGRMRDKILGLAGWGVIAGRVKARVWLVRAKVRAKSW